MPDFTANRLLRRLGDLLCPDACGVCGLTAAEDSLCRACRAELPWIASACPRCACPRSALPTATLPCADCQRHPPPFVEAFAPLSYAFPVDAMLKALKFDARLDLARPLAACALPWLSSRASQIDALVPIPLHRFRNARRGFNQVEELLRPLRHATGLPVRHCLRRAKRTQSQSGLTADQRRANLRHAFRLAREPRCRHVLLVDDVMTTGATVREASRVLLEAGVASVSVLAIARAASSVQAATGSKV